MGAKEEERERGGLRDGGREEGWKTGRNLRGMNDKG